MSHLLRARTVQRSGGRRSQLDSSKGRGNNPYDTSDTVFDQEKSDRISMDFVAQDDFLREPSLKKSQIKLNNDIKVIEQQIKDLGLDFKQETVDESNKSLFERIRQKELDSGLGGSFHDKIKAEKQKNQSKIDHLKSDLEMKRTKIEGILDEKRIKLSLLETKIKNLIKIGENQAKVEFFVLEFILDSECFEQLQETLRSYDSMIKSLTDLEKASTRLEMDRDYFESYYSSDFISSEVNTMRLKAQYHFKQVFKLLIQRVKTPADRREKYLKNSIKSFFQKFELEGKSAQEIVTHLSEGHKHT